MTQQFLTHLQSFPLLPLRAVQIRLQSGNSPVTQTAYPALYPGTNLGFLVPAETREEEEIVRTGEGPFHLRMGLSRTTPTLFLLKLYHFPMGYLGCSCEASISPCLIFMLSGLFALTQDKVKQERRCFLQRGLHYIFLLV